MSRSGWSNSNFLRVSSAIVSAAPLTLNAFAKFAALPAANRHLLGIYNSGSTANINLFSLELTSGGAINARTAAGSAGNNATSGTTTGAGVWFCGTAVFDITTGTDRAAFLNGGGKGTNTTNRTPSGLNRTTIGLRDNVSADQNPGSTDDLAEVSLFNTNLSDANVLRIAQGFDPRQVAGANLVGFWPLVGDYDPEKDYAGANDMVIQGSLSYDRDHPNVIYRYVGKQSAILRPGDGPMSQRFAAQFWKSRPAYTVIYEAKSLAADLDMAVQLARTTTASVDMAVQAAATRAASLDMAIQQALTAAASLDLAVFTANVNTAQMDMAVQQARTALVSLDMAVQMAVSSAAMLDMAVQVPRSAIASLDLAIQQAVALATALDLAVQAPAFAAASLDMFVDDGGGPPPTDEGHSRGMIADVGRMMH